MAQHHHSTEEKRGIPRLVWICVIAVGIGLAAILAGFPVGILAALACPLLHLLMGHGMGHGEANPSTTPDNQPWIRRIREGETNHG